MWNLYILCIDIIGQQSTGEEVSLVDAVSEQLRGKTWNELIALRESAAAWHTRVSQEINERMR